MKNHIYDLYTITAITNMHVGSGDAEIGIIENKIQRDHICETPVINSSSLKGALREHCDAHLGEPGVSQIFGPESTIENKNTKPGEYKFFSAHILSLPVRSGVKPFYRATAKMVIDQFNESLKLFNIDNRLPVGHRDAVKHILDNFSDKASPSIHGTETNKIDIEEYEATCIINSCLETNVLFGNSIALFSDTQFKEICKQLPVVARNNLENGVSKNLWYEEILPRQSIFYFIIGKPDEPDKTLQTKFDTVIQKEPVQIGGNATIGYGYTTIKKVTNGTAVKGSVIV